MKGGDLLSLDLSGFGLGEADPSPTGDSGGLMLDL